MTDATPRRQDFSYLHRLATRWSDMDLLGHVNNARFFSFDEDARLAYFHSLWADDPRFWKDYGFILASISCDFLSQLHHPSDLEIGFRIARLGRSSMQTQGALFVEERVVAVTRGVVVWFDYQQQKTQPLPEPVRAMIRQREVIPPLEEGRNGP